MDDVSLRARSALEGVLRPGRQGAASGPPGVTVREWMPEGVASLAVRRGQEAVLPAMLGGLGLTLPNRPGWTEGGGLNAVWAGPGRWLVFGGPDVVALLGARVGSIAAITDQTDARVLLRVSGPRVRDMLAKGIAIDLHPRTFGPRDAASTTVAHIVVHFWQLDDAPSYDLAAPRGFAGSLVEWLVAAAAEYGLEILPPLD